VPSHVPDMGWLFRHPYIVVMSIYPGKHSEIHLLPASPPSKSGRFLSPSWWREHIIELLFFVCVGVQFALLSILWSRFSWNSQKVQLEIICKHRRVRISFQGLTCLLQLVTHWTSTIERIGHEVKRGSATDKRCF